MKSVFFILLILVVALSISGCSTVKSSKSQSQSFEAMTLSLAKEEYKSGELAVAKVYLQDVMKTDPKNQAAQYYLGLVEDAQTAHFAKANELRQPQGWYQTMPQQPVSSQQ